MENFIREIETSTPALIEVLDNLSEEQSKFKINSMVWSIHECMEHIVISEIGVYRILMTHNEEAPQHENPEKLGKEKIAKILGNRTVKSESPENVRPIGRFSNLDELKAKFHSNRQRICDGLRNNEFVFDNQLFKHPVLGELTKKDWLNFLIHHARRHLKQIEEIRSFIQFQMI